MVTIDDAVIRVLMRRCILRLARLGYDREQASRILCDAVDAQLSDLHIQQMFDDLRVLATKGEETP